MEVTELQDLRQKLWS